MKKILIINANYYNKITNNLVLTSKRILRKKKIIGLEGFGLKIKKQIIIKWKKF